MKAYKKNLGEPTEYKGDPFQTVIAWKWSFINEKKEKISLILQHNQMSEEDKIGNAVKMTLTTQLEKERACFAVQNPSSEKKMTDKKRSTENDWNLFVPY